MAGVQTPPEVKLPSKEDIQARLGGKPKETPPVAQTPPSTPPAKETVTPQKTEPKAEISLETFNKAYGTQYKTNEEIKADIEDGKRFKEVNPKYDEIKKKYADLELKSKEDPFADDFVKGLNDLKKNGATQEQVKAYVHINSVDMDKLSNEEKTILTYQLRDGLTEREARIAFAEEYSVSENDYELREDLDEDELKKEKGKIASQIEKETIRLKRDAKAVDSFLSDYKKKVSTAEKPEDTFRKSWNDYEPQVKEIAPAIAENYAGLKGIPLSAGKEGEAMTFDFEVPDDFKKAIPHLVESFLMSEFAAGRPVKLNQDGLGKIRTHLDITLKGYAFDKFIMDSNIHTASKVREEMANKNSNGGKKHNGDIPPPSGEQQDSISKYKQKMIGRPVYHPTEKVA